MSTLQSEIRTYSPAIFLDAVLHRTTRRTVTRVLGVLTALLGTTLLCYFVYTRVTGMPTSFTEGNMGYATGSFFILLALYILLLQISFFYNTLYFRGFSALLREDFTDTEGLAFESSVIALHAKSDLTQAFLASSYGEEIFLRLGIQPTKVRTFISSPRTALAGDTLPLAPHTFTTPEDIGTFLLTHDEAFKTFLFDNGVREDLFTGATSWIARSRLLHKNTRRWWSRDSLGKVSGIGRDFSYGITFELERYIRSLESASSSAHSLQRVSYATETITKMESILARSKSANVILVGESGVGKIDMLIELERRIKQGESVESLTAKHLVLFDAQAFTATHASKAEFEYAFLTLMSETERAGNIIVVIENFTSFLKSVRALDVDAGELLSRFLVSSEIQIVTTVETNAYHESLEQNQELLQYFEAIRIETPNELNTVLILEEAVPALEEAHRIFFTYPALVRVAESADQFIIDGVMPDKALSLLSLIASSAEQKRTVLVREEFVDACVSEKTGIPSGPVRDTERDLLINLEEVLHKRVVGQETALHVVASAMRRARAGIQSKEKPIGSFLFLGSTGVGKTETAKALAHTFFGSEEKMVRFDMSEFSEEDGLLRLIGSTENAGALSSALREHPYCVLLLDELEKASVSVHDLFLQILDEGSFTDGRNTHINMRNSIVIATSNAGSDLIWQFTKEGKNIADEKDAVVNAIIEKHTFKPELINRFDAVVLFETLSSEHQEQIAGLMLQDLALRIKERGYTLTIDKTLLSVLMKKGYDPEFGARPMRRAIQDILEEKIALKIISGGLRQGDTIQFTKEDFAE